MNNTKPNQEDSATDPIINKGKYRLNMSDDPEEFGYHLISKNKVDRISNFFIILNKFNKGSRNQESYSNYQGEVVLSDGNTVSFERLPANYFSASNSLHTFLENLCGNRAIIYGSASALAKAIKSFNSNIEETVEKEFGFNDELTEYYTGDMVISAESIIGKKTPIKYNENWGNSKVGFKLAGANLDEVKSFIINKLLIWDEPEIMYSLLSFSFMPIIYPFLKDTNPNKFYLMLKGPSGSGKSQMSKWAQNFYGDFGSLFPWTSTDTSITVKGQAFKDALFAVDDLKLHNFRCEADVKKAQGMIQNYSDGCGRQRSSGSLKNREEISIKGHLLISGEDIVFTESSTQARGIIINVKSKPVQKVRLSEINEMSIYFSSLTPEYIQYVLKNFTKERVEKIFNDSCKWISDQPSICDPDIPSDNLGREINNFAALKTSWEIFSSFLFTDQLFGHSEYTDTFNNSIIKLLLENINRIGNQRSDAVFESSLWEFIEEGTFAVQKVLHGGILEQVPRGAKVVGHYSLEQICEPKLVINIKAALCELIKRVPNFSISEETLVSKLKSDGKITLNPSGKVSFNKYKARGAEWIGPYPKIIIGLRDLEDPVTQANMILDDSYENVLL